MGWKERMTVVPERTPLTDGRLGIAPSVQERPGIRPRTLIPIFEGGLRGEPGLGSAIVSRQTERLRPDTPLAGMKA